MGEVTALRGRVVLAALAALIATVATCIAASPASATHGTTPIYDPQTTNVPYLGWRGEELRLVKCAAEINVDEEGEGESRTLVAGQGQSVDWIVEDWSGYPFQPPALETSTVKFFVGTDEHEDEGCVKADFVSLKAGLAMIKLVVSDDDTGNPVMKHQFLVGWLGLNNPVCREVALDTQPGGGGALGDPLGDGNFIPGAEAGRVQCDVSGELPLGNNFTELGLPGSITLPAETPFTDLDDPDNTYWDELAERLATTSSSVPLYRDNPWRMWDIHDDRARGEGHVNPAVCRVPASATHVARPDAVDDCGSFLTSPTLNLFFNGVEFYSGLEEYSRVFASPDGESDMPTIGPFDPLRPDETLLSDGKLDGGDVPMPAARLDVSIAANTGALTDISGAGSLDSAPKCLAYTRDHVCLPGATAPNPIHRHYAPYYFRYIPATGARVGQLPLATAPYAAEASGNDGPAVGNNYPGYTRFFGTQRRTFDTARELYAYWEMTDVLRRGLGGRTNCLRRVDGNPQTEDYRLRPSGPQSIVVWTDEHGEAQVRFRPGLDFFFDAVLARAGRVVNANNACDLEDIDVLGTADIQAIARYPYQKTTDSDKASNVVTKTIGNLFHKRVDCVPKGPVPPITNSFAFICTALAIDIDGSPFVNEKVCFMTNGEGAREYPLGRAHTSEGLHRLCVWTDNGGRASIEVFGKCEQGNVIAEFVEEGIIRYSIFEFGCPPGAAAGSSTTSSGSGTSAASGSAAPAGDVVLGASNAHISSIIAKVDSDAKASPVKKTARATLAFANIVKKPYAKASQRYVVVRVNGSAKTAKVQVTLIGKKGRVLGKVVRTVPTNRAVRVPNLKLPKAAKTARVRVLG